MSFLISFGLHAALLFGTAGIFVQPPKYDVEAGSGGVEVSLIAAPARQVPAGPALPTPKTETQEEGPIVETAPEAAGPEGDGSSPVPGQDPTTFYLPGGASGTGGRLKNPAPAYPYAAIRQGQQGLVVLEVLVDKGGRPASVEIHQSSGFTLLDQSALWTVRRWKFDPAHVGLIPTNARIRVPIRFMLDKKE
jgi:protein TonB